MSRAPHARKVEERRAVESQFQKVKADFERRLSRAEERAAQKPQRALIVDDDPSVCRVFGRILEGQAGMAVEMAGTTDEALVRVGALTYDVILADLRMDGSTAGGLELIRDLRRLRPGVPILVISGTEDETAPVRARAAGADLFLRKPVDASLLVEAVRRLLRSMSAQTV